MTGEREKPTPPTGVENSDIGKENLVGQAENPILKHLVDIRGASSRAWWMNAEQRRGRRDVLGEGLQYLKSSFANAETVTEGLEVLAAASSEDVYDWLRMKEIFGKVEVRELIKQAIAKIIELGEEEGYDPEELSRAIYSQAYQEQTYGKESYYRDYQHNHMGFVSKTLHAVSGVKDRKLPPNFEAIKAAFRDGKSVYGYKEMVYFCSLERRGMGEFDTQTFFSDLDPMESMQLDGAIEALVDMEPAHMSKEGLKWMEISLRLFQKFLTTTADRLRIPNGKIVQDLFTRQLENNHQVTGRQAYLTYKDIVIVANALRSQLGEQKIPFSAANLDEQVVSAYDTIADVVVNYGQNNLTDEQKANLLTFIKIASDTFVIGKYIRDTDFKTKTIGEFLSEHPEMSAQRLESILNEEKSPSPEDPDNPVRDLRKEFGSVVYWKAKQAGFGTMS